MVATLPASIIRLRRTYPELEPLLERIRDTYAPDDVLLFGSRARGTAGDDSDWDLMIILPDDSSESLLDPILGWETQHESGVHADILLSLRSEFLADMSVVNSLAREVARDGVGLIGG
jgi:predicted nucleotidyltransferase